MAWVAMRQVERAVRAADALQRARVDLEAHGDWLIKLDAQFKRLQGRLYAEKRGSPAPNGAADPVDPDLEALLHHQSAPPVKP